MANQEIPHLQSECLSCRGVIRQHLAVSAEAVGHRAALANLRKAKVCATFSIMLAQSPSNLLLTPNPRKWILNESQEESAGSTLSVQRTQALGGLVEALHLLLF